MDLESLAAVVVDSSKVTTTMNVKSQNPTDLVIGLLSRSTCAVQVAALLVDNHGVFAWGWNNMGPKGLGWHAEAHCLSRANRSRLPGSTLYVAAMRSRNGKIVTARPCLECQPKLTAIGSVIYRDADGTWVKM